MEEPTYYVVNPMQTTMINVFTKLKGLPVRALPVGRWKAEKSFEEAMRAVDLANSDSCYVSETPKYVHTDNDIIDIEIPLIGGFHLHSKNTVYKK